LHRKGEAFVSSVGEKTRAIGRELQSRPMGKRDPLIFGKEGGYGQTQRKLIYAQEEQRGEN